MDWSFLFLESSLLVIFVAPVAHGKTRLVLELVLKYRGPWIYFSPLKALALEVAEKFSQNYPVILFEKKEKEKIFLWIGQRTDYLIILTEHQWIRELGDWINGPFPSRRPMVVWDEFHLLEHWGWTFRKGLWEIFLEISNSGTSILGLTATVNQEIRQKIREEYILGFSQIILINAGNHQFKNPPKNIFYYPAAWKSLLIRRMAHDLFQNQKKGNKEVFLCFCRTRREVDHWVAFFSRKGLTVLGCKGGEVEEFRKNLVRFPHPHGIFSTSCLGHGVNLPPLKKIYINYPTHNLDFWIQMAGRGGRQGEAYEVFTLDTFYLQGIFQKIWRWLKVILRDLWISFG